MRKGAKRAKNPAAPSLKREPERASEHPGPMEPGKLYASIRGLLEPAYPQLAFIVELPFHLELLVDGMLGVVVPLKDIRTGESQDSVVRVRVGEVVLTERESAAAFRYLRSLPGRTEADKRPMPTPSARKRTTDRAVTVVELITPNVLPDAPSGTPGTEVAVRLFARCMMALNRFLGAYVVATEDHSVRQLALEALAPYVLVELRDANAEPLGFAGILTLPSATRPEHFNTLAPDELLQRLNTSMRHEGASHPMDVVVLWQMRARHYSEVAGDYEMALMALNTSAEVLLDAVWDTHRVDEGQDSSMYDKRPQFAKTLKAVADELGQPWTKEDPDSAWAVYFRDCYEMRNETAHEGRQVGVDDLDAAIDAYTAMRSSVEKLTLATADIYPRTALMVHGPRGLEVAGALAGRVADELKAIVQEGALAFWLPKDLRVPD